MLTTGGKHGIIYNNTHIKAALFCRKGINIMANLTESQCLALIKYVSDTLTSKKTESAVSEIVDRFRAVFGVSCVSIREIFSRPCSLRYTYESMEGDPKEKRINVTITFDENEWQTAMEIFSRGSYIYKKAEEQGCPLFMGPFLDKPGCMVQVPMYSGSDFFGVLDLVCFGEPRDWSEPEISALNISANFICQYLYRLNVSFMELYNRNDTDPLTGLMSFNTFTNRLDEKLVEMLNDAPVGVVYIDIHHFKYINETYGYAKGDELLKLTAQTIVEGITQFTDIMICRSYADHFISAASVPEKFIPFFSNFVEEQNKQICDTLQKSCPDVIFRINTGIFFVKDHRFTAATAMANANLARKLAKQEHMRKPLVFSDEMMEDIKYQEFLNSELPKAIESHALKVYYQPKINCADDSLYGAEALVRWQKPDGTFIYPDQFIPVFEKNGNIVDVDFYVYREVFKYIRGRMDAGLPVFPISMNVSRVHFRSERIIPYVGKLLEEYDIPPELVEFELTENIYMKNFDRADEFIKTCRQSGIKVSMDDFGSGYSSLNVISSLSIDTLKIDKIFLKNQELSHNDKTVIESMIIMAKRLGMRVICEGVETESQSLFLKNAQCDQIQGYYYGKPMDEDSFNKFAERLLANK